jgi:hypothetical protein
MWEYEDGTPMQEDADAFLDMLEGLTHLVEVLVGREQ